MTILKEPYVKKSTNKSKQISYSKLEKLSKLMYKRIRSDQKCFQKLANRIEQDSFFHRESPGGFKVLINDIKLKQIRIKNLEKKVADYEEANKEFAEQNEELRERLYGKSYLALKQYALGRDKKKDH